MPSTETFMRTARFEGIVRTHALAVGVHGDVSRMKPGKTRDYHLSRLADVIDVRCPPSDVYDASSGGSVASPTSRPWGALNGGGSGWATGSGSVELGSGLSLGALGRQPRRFCMSSP